MRAIIILMILVGLCYGHDVMNYAIERTSLSDLDWRVNGLAQVSSFEGSGGMLFSKNIKSVPRALLYSLAVPGAGEFYCKSYVKAGIMLGLEAAFWAFYFAYNKKGDDKTREFEQFADEHWKKELFMQWLTIADTISVPPVEHLPETKDQQYYEMIGKYDWFITGWDDFSGDRSDPDPTHLRGKTTEHREIYLSMRADANRFYKTAKYFVGASILNHIVSALDAAFTAKMHNDKINRGLPYIHFRSRFVMHPRAPEYNFIVEVSFR